MTTGTDYLTLIRAPDEVCQALTTADGLSAWLGERAGIDLRPGGAATMTVAGRMTVDMRVDRVVETGVAQFPVDTRRQTYNSHSTGWSRELAELAEHLNGA